MAENLIPPIVFELITGAAERNYAIVEEVLATLTHAQVANVAMNAVAMLGAIYRDVDFARAMIDIAREESNGSDWPDAPA